jgi:hypothetical protein
MENFVTAVNTNKNSGHFGYPHQHMENCCVDDEDVDDDDCGDGRGSHRPINDLRFDDLGQMLCPTNSQPMNDSPKGGNRPCRRRRGKSAFANKNLYSIASLLKILNG